MSPKCLSKSLKKLGVSSSTAKRALLALSWETLASISCRIGGNLGILRFLSSPKLSWIELTKLKGLNVIIGYSDMTKMGSLENHHTRKGKASVHPYIFFVNWWSLHLYRQIWTWYRIQGHQKLQTVLPKIAVTRRWTVSISLPNSIHHKDIHMCVSRLGRPSFMDFPARLAPFLQILGGFEGFLNFEAHPHLTCF